MISFRLQDYIRRELAGLRKVMTDEQIRDLVTVPPLYVRWLDYEGRQDPAFRRMATYALRYREAMLEMME